MTEFPDHIFDLLMKELTEGLDFGENEQLRQWLGKSEENRTVYREMQELWLSGSLAGLKTGKRTTTAWAEISTRVNARKKRRLLLTAVSVAASVAIMVGVYLGMEQFRGNTDNQWAELNMHAVSTESVRLVLPSGEELALADSVRGDLDVDGESVYKDLSGIFYHDSLNAKSQVASVIHELIIPKGGHYVLTLVDGTTVTLNSESSITYPTHFSDSLREVWLEGEAYFDVEHNPAKPFIVHSGGMRTQVLGTQFNVKAYDGDVRQSVTLVEGSVELSIASEKVRLKPGFQFYRETGEQGQSGVEQVDTYLYTSWKEGIMYFDDITLQELMTRLTRWYNFDYEFKDQALKERLFTGGVKKGDDLQKIFSLIGMVNDVSFSIKGDRIIIDKK
ncbi:FecR family protein [Mangrovibacterium lignilyticum]|uniref:FecR family protein n=1 Tax=Mangrovibacterium lignilyticum TaxID=2668052 RepID=UPI0013D4FAB7|nr:FecR family protein [Mangrovibacterium lignilyticum]